MGKKNKNKNNAPQHPPAYPHGGGGFEPPPYGYPAPPTADQLEEMALNAEIQANEHKVRRLKRTRGPCSITGCMLNLLLFIALSLLLIFFIIFLFVDRFEVLTLIRDIAEQFNLMNFFRAIGRFFRDLFTGRLFRSGNG